MSASWFELHNYQISFMICGNIFDLFPDALENDSWRMSMISSWIFMTWSICTSVCFPPCALDNAQLWSVRDPLNDLFHDL